MKFALLAQAHQQHPFAGQAGQVVQHQGLTGLAAMVATAHNGGQCPVTGRVQRLGRVAQVTGFVHTHHQACAPLFFRTAAFDAEMHDHFSPELHESICSGSDAWYRVARLSPPTAGAGPTGLAVYGKH